jgi:phosphinothricin acetyltransferase
MVGTFHKCGYKFQHWYDMVWMEKLISEHDVPVRPVRWFPVLAAGD